MEALKSRMESLPVITVGVAAVLLHVLWRRWTKRSLTELRGKRIVITGASSGIGEELAYQYAKLGAKLVLAARRVHKLEGVVKKCKELGGDAIGVQTDVTNEADCKALVEAAVQKFKGIDILVLNAGQGCLLKFEEVTDQQVVRNVFDVNFWGYVTPTQYALPVLRRSKGTIVVISSNAALIPTPRRTIYGASKAAVNQFFDCLRQEEKDIKITVVCPGFVVSEIHDKAVKSGPMRRDLSKFMSTQKCASIIIDAALQGKRNEIMTFQARLAHKLRPFIPGFIDKLSASVSEKSVLAEQ